MSTHFNFFPSVAHPNTMPLIRQECLFSAHTIYLFLIKCPDLLCFVTGNSKFLTHWQTVLSRVLDSLEKTHFFSGKLVTKSSFLRGTMWLFEEDAGFEEASLFIKTQHLCLSENFPSTNVSQAKSHPINSLSHCFLAFWPNLNVLESWAVSMTFHLGTKHK